MKMSGREMILASAAAVVLLTGVIFIAGKPVFEKWTLLGDQIRDERVRLENDRSLIQSRADWEEKFKALGSLMPAFPAEKKMDIHWLTVMDQMASRNGLLITKRKVGDEKRIGDVYELSIDVAEWEGSLDALVHFLFDLQNLGVMMDIKQLYIKPLEGSRLRGRFTLNCAFSRGNGGLTE